MPKCSASFSPTIMAFSAFLLEAAQNTHGNYYSQYSVLVHEATLTLPTVPKRRSRKLFSLEYKSAAHNGKLMQ